MNPNEDMAESIAYYISNPQVLLTTHRTSMTSFGTASCTVRAMWP